MGSELLLAKNFGKIEKKDVFTDNMAIIKDQASLRALLPTIADNYSLFYELAVSSKKFQV